MNAPDRRRLVQDAGRRLEPLPSGRPVPAAGADHDPIRAALDVIRELVRRLEAEAREEMDARTGGETLDIRNGFQVAEAGCGATHERLGRRPAARNPEIQRPARNLHRGLARAGNDSAVA